MLVSGFRKSVCSGIFSALYFNKATKLSDLDCLAVDLVSLYVDFIYRRISQTRGTDSAAEQNIYVNVDHLQPVSKLVKTTTA